MKKTNILLSVATAALVFTGCGGGGSSSDPETSVITETPTTTEAYSVTQTAELKTSETATGATNITGSTTTGTVDTTGKATETLVGEITADTTLTQDKVWILDGLVTVKNEATLTIEAGTVVAGKDGTGDNTSYMIIDKGSKIMAEGTATEPIIFTSQTAVNGGTAAVGQWGGLTIIGKAGNDQVQAYEVNSAFVADDSDLTDNSGSLKHVQILNSGITMETDKEINGLSLVGVGSGTTVENITVNRSDDDCVEIWGGTVNLNNVTISECTDDQFDIDDGYAGTVTNLKITQNTGNAGIEMSGTTAATFDGVEITQTTSVKEGGLFFKKDGIGGNFKNVTIVNNSSSEDGSLYSSGEIDTDNTSFDNVILKGTSEYKITGDSAELIHTKFNAGQ